MSLNSDLLGFNSTTFGINLELEIWPFGFVYSSKQCTGNLAT